MIYVKNKELEIPSVSDYPDAEKHINAGVVQKLELEMGKTLDQVQKTVGEPLGLGEAPLEKGGIALVTFWKNKRAVRAKMRIGELLHPKLLQEGYPRFFKVKFLGKKEQRRRIEGFLEISDPAAVMILDEETGELSYQPQHGEEKIFRLTIDRVSPKPKKKRKKIDK